MTLHGTYRNRNNDLIDVRIYSAKAGEDIEITPNSDVQFSADGVTINTECDSTFEHIIRKSCVITLSTKTYLGDYLFTVLPDDTPVTIYKNEEIVFAGFVVPAMYSQGYAHEIETLQINCVDYLSTLQNKMMTDSRSYDEITSSAHIRTFKDYIDEIFSDVSKMQLGTYTPHVYFDQSKKPVTGDGIFSHAAVTEKLFIGDSEDDLLTYDEMLTEMLKYLNLHIIQEGADFYIFDWETKRVSGTVSWVDLLTGVSHPVTYDTVEVDKTFYADDNTNMSIADLYNKLKITCNIEAMDNLLTSPLESDALTSPYRNKQLFMKELYALGTSDYSKEAYKDLIRTGTTEHGEGRIRPWYMQVMNNKNWKFYYQGQDIYSTLREVDSLGDCINQWKFLKYMKEHRFASAIVSFGNGGTKDVFDDAPVTDASMTDSIIISVNGQYRDTEQAKAEFNSDISACKPICEYTGTTSGLFSPVDDATTNYIVFSGKFCYVPLMMLSGPRNGAPLVTGVTYIKSTNTYPETKRDIDNIDVYWTVPYSEDEDGCFYMHQFFEQDNPVGGTPVCNEANYSPFIYPMSDIQGTTEFEYNFSRIGDETDKINKIPVIECEMKIGDKYCVETFKSIGNNMYESEYGWYTEDNLPLVNGAPKRSFSLGFNPKIGDYIIGKEHEIQSNFTISDNIDATKGTVIPIKKSDNLAGSIQFKILGLNNGVWNDISKETSGWWVFSGSSWSEHDRLILDHCSSVIIKDFECTITTDNAGYQNNGDNDLVYVTDVDIEHPVVKDDIEFNINTALTSAEANALSIKNTNNISSAIDATSSTAMTSIIDVSRSETDKPEKLYLNAYYNEYSTPKILMNTCWHDYNSVGSYFNRFAFTYFQNKTFYPVSSTYDLMKGTIDLTLKEK